MVNLTHAIKAISNKVSAFTVNDLSMGRFLPSFTRTASIITPQTSLAISAYWACLKVISEADKDKHGNIRWACQCECGKSTIVVGDNLRRGLSKSCGCLRRELSKKQFTTHGMARTPTYQTWCHMLNRCRNKKDKGIF